MGRDGPDILGSRRTAGGLRSQPRMRDRPVKGSAAPVDAPLDHPEHIHPAHPARAEPARGIERHRGVLFSAAIPAASR